MCLQVKWRNIHFVMWDIGGQESLRQAWNTYYTGTHFLLLVVDSTDRERLAIAKEELYKMLGHEVWYGPIWQRGRRGVRDGGYCMA